VHFLYSLRIRDVITVESITLRVRNPHGKKKLTVSVFVFHVLNFCPCFWTINNSCKVVNAKFFTSAHSAESRYLIVGRMLH